MPDPVSFEPDTTDFRSLLDDACQQVKIFRRQMRGTRTQQAEEVRYRIRP